MRKRNIKIIMIAALAAATLMGPLSGMIAEGATIRAISNVNVRASGSLAAEKIGYVHSGQKVKVLGIENDWYKIEIDGLIGYTYRSFWSGQTATSVARANVRATAQQFSPPIQLVDSATQAIVLGRSGEWLYIEHNGVKGFSHKTYWDVAESVFTELRDATAESEAAAKLLLEAEVAKDKDKKTAEGKETAADDEKADPEGSSQTIYPETPGLFTVATKMNVYASAADAQAGTSPTGTQPVGTYLIGQSENGMLNLAETSDAPGLWIDPADASIADGDEYILLDSLPGHMDAMNAAAGTDPVVTVTPGSYYIYRVFDGMYNVSTSQTVPGAWIDPRKNRETGVSLDPADSPIGDRIVDEAVKLIGAPYILGAESWDEGGFDCSGVTQFSYDQLGITLPRRASQQWEGIEGKVTVPRPGDIVAFEKEGSVYHVGIYVGDNQMIHAPKPGDLVKLSDLAWWYKNSTVKGFLRPYSD